jgi:hypothetical protein
LKTKQIVIALIVVAVVAALLYWGRDQILRFSITEFWAQLRQADWTKIAIGLGCIYVAYVIRAFRWARLMRHNKQVSPLSLIGTQVIGFTAVALIGRVADPVRPYLVSRKTGDDLGSQIAVYITERLFDAGTMAFIFSCVILLAPAGAMPHPEIVKKAGMWGMALTLAGAFFLFSIRLAGGLVASLFEKVFGMASSELGKAVGHKIRTFRAGLNTMRSFGDFAWVAGLSLFMWGLITYSYLATAQAFTASPELSGMTLAKSILLLAFSGGASTLQLPILGWFTQIGFVAAAMTRFYGVGQEASTACAATILLVTFLGVVPIGLIWAQFDHISLRKLTHESEDADQSLDVN